MHVIEPWKQVSALPSASFAYKGGPPRPLPAGSARSIINEGVATESRPYILNNYFAASPLDEVNLMI